MRDPVPRATATVAAMSAVDQWAASLAEWGIPDEILAAAPQSPWIHPVSTFTPSGDLFVDTPSRHLALDALSPGDSVLDVGCGGGRAAFGLTPPATEVVGVDHQAGMLEVFAAQAAERGVTCTTVLGDWPDMAPHAPVCDVVVCHHVFYNVADLGPFAQALAARARRRVVVELPQRHPLSRLSPAWEHFWGLQRPQHPTAHDAVAVLAEIGIDAAITTWEEDAPSARPVTDVDVEHTRIRLCLTADRDDEVREFLTAETPTGRSLATIHWDV